MTTIDPYLHFNGNAEEAFNFYKTVFNSEFSGIMRYKDVPPSEHKMSESEGQKIMHISLPIGQETILLGSDLPASYGKAIVGTNFYLSVNTESEDDTTRLFNDLAAGGRVNMPLDKTFWGAYFGMMTDKFGIQWMVSYDYK